MAKVHPIDINSPLYLHPSEGSNSINVGKLIGSTDYRVWKRSMEIPLSSKRKLRFVANTVTKDSKDAIKADMWDTCNNMAWKLWNQAEIILLIDSVIINDSSFHEDIIRCIHVALLCVQEFPKDRPGITTIISMIQSEKQTYHVQSSLASLSANSIQMKDLLNKGKEGSGSNNMSITTMSAR